MSQEVGKKDDKQKLRWSLLPIKPIESVIQVLMWGAKKYGDYNWKSVPRARERYYDAALRHITEYGTGRKKDKESKLPVLAHAVCCLLFLMYFDRGTRKYDQPNTK